MLPDFIRTPRLSALLALGVAVTVCLALSGCSASLVRGSPTKTPTCGSVPSSVATQSMPQRIISVAEPASCDQLHDLSATYQSSSEVTEITGTVSGAIPVTSSQISASQERVKTLCFEVERALWTSGLPVQEVTVTILGTVFDDYMDQVVSWYGTADLGATAAARVHWSSLTADQAWTLFDRTELRTDYATFQQWGRTPGPSSSPSNP